MLLLPKVALSSIDLSSELVVKETYTIQHLNISQSHFYRKSAHHDEGGGGEKRSETCSFFSVYLRTDTYAYVSAADRKAITHPVSLALLFFIHALGWATGLLLLCRQESTRASLSVSSVNSPISRETTRELSDGAPILKTRVWCIPTDVLYV